MVSLWRVFWTLLAIMITKTSSLKQPHVVLMLADDLGWNDVGWNNADLKTPHLNKLAYNGVILNQSYSQAVCSPSRAALLTGLYPIHTGMQHGVVQEKQTKGVPLEYKFLPRHLKKSGYKTHAIGKWHLGFCKWEYTPTFRGFDSFYGFYLGAENYMTHAQGPPSGDYGIDFRDDTDVVRDQNGTYSTVSFSNRAVKLIDEHNKSDPMFLYLSFQSVHSPLQVPKHYEKMYSHNRDYQRRIFSGMVTAMDAAVGKVVEALEANDMMNDTIIIFLSDNGGAPYYGGNNWPLRGAKTTLWEGGTRTPGLVYSKWLKKSQYVYNGMVHLVDWFPTLLHLAGDQSNISTDGIDQWSAISEGLVSPRTEMLYNIDNIKKNNKTTAAIRMGDFKLIVGDPGKYSDWYKVTDKAKWKKWWKHRFWLKKMRRMKKKRKMKTLKEKERLRKISRWRKKKQKYANNAKRRKQKSRSKRKKKVHKKQKRAHMTPMDEKKKYKKIVNKTIFRGVWNWICCKTRNALDKGALYTLWLHFCCDDKEDCCPSCSKKLRKVMRRIGHQKVKGFKEKIWKTIETKKKKTSAKPYLTKKVQKLMWNNFYEDRLQAGIRLYNLREDPTEKYNLARKYPQIVEKLMRRLHKYELSSRPALNPPSTQMASPSNFDKVWSPGWC